MRPTAVVMNLYYTGLGIARSLGEHGIPVIGLTAQHGIYGNFTRYAKTIFAPDSRNEPEALVEHLLKLGTELGHRSVIFPTRDDDVLLLDRFRQQLEPHFILTIPESPVLQACLSKWETYQWAQKAGVPTPRCWQVNTERDLPGILEEVTYPCVLKPIASYHWRKGGNWTLVGARKAIGIFSREQLIAEYTAISRANEQALLQQMVPGSDDCLIIAACYLDRESRWVAGFNTQKLIQSPEGFGTGCIVQAVDRPELMDRTFQLLHTMRFTGIAEVEYKWDAGQNDYQLIEINPRPWDQHRLGRGCGTDLVYLAYCEHAGLPIPVVRNRPAKEKWIADDTFILTALRLLLKRDPKLRTLFSSARGRRIYGIWSAKDPLPSLLYFMLRFFPDLMRTGWQFVRSLLKRKTASQSPAMQTKLAYENQLGRGKSHV